MTSPAKDLHFILIPLIAQGHMIPMVDIARILALRRVTVTIVTTPVNANRFRPVIARAAEEKLGIRLLEFQFPSTEVGLPEGCENFDMVATAEEGMNMFLAIDMLKERVGNALQELKPAPSCIISDRFLYWTTGITKKLGIPRLIFYGPGCFPLLSMNNLVTSRITEGLASDSQRFVIPGLPDQIEVTKVQVLIATGVSESTELFDKVLEAEKASYGIVVNTFRELEPEYVKEYTKVKGKKLWCIGPVSLCNEKLADMAERGNKAAIDEHDFLKWLDSREPNSVLYVCLGSLSRTSVAQMIELGTALELSNRPFIWCVRNKSADLEELFLEDFEERVRDRGLIVHGWAPQVLILSHGAIGGFMTHCGWNSTLEGVCAGVPMITWPHFAEQFINEKFIVEVLKIGVSSGVEVPVMFGEEEKMGVVLKRDEIKTAIDSLMMDEGREASERRKRATELAVLAKQAMGEEGSSGLSVTLLIQDIAEQVINNKQN